jgi:parvulin-like peptidyl-prolyl isomerase
MVRSSRIKIATALLFSILFFLIATPSYAKILDKIIAVVNDEVITQSEIDSMLYPLYLQYSQIYKTDKEVYENLDKSRAEILKQLVHDKLILSEARKLEVTVSEEEIDERIEIVKKELADKGTSFEDLMKQQKLTSGDIRRKYREQIMIQKVIDRQVRRMIDIQPSEATIYYQDHIEDYAQPEQVAVYAIMIKLRSERTPIECRQLAADVRKMASEGRDFQELAKNYSEDSYRDAGGDLGFIRRGQLLKEIDSAIFFLKVGGISDVIETPIGYHIFKVYDRKEESIVPFEEVREKVHMAIYGTKVQKKFEDWLDELKSNAYISIK